MQATLKLRDSDPHDDFAIAPETVPAAWADKVLADITRDAAVMNSPGGSSPASDRQVAAAPGAAVAAPTVDTTFRATVADDGGAPAEHRPASRWAKGAVMLVLAIGSAGAAAAWHTHGDAGRQTISNWMPGFAIAASPPTEAAAIAEPADTPAAQTAAAELTPEPASVPAQPAESAAPAAVAPSPSTETVQLESMARDLAAMAQQVEQLKASLAELKTSQQAIVREAAKTSEVKPAAPNPRPRTATRPKRSAAAPPPRPLPAYPAATAAAPAPLPQPASPPVSMLSAPPPSPQAATRTEDGEPIVRPPMPLR